MAIKNTKNKILQGGATTAAPASKPADPTKAPMASAANPDPQVDVNPQPQAIQSWAGANPDAVKPEWQNGPTLNEEQLEKEKNKPQAPQGPRNPLRVKPDVNPSKAVDIAPNMPKNAALEKTGVDVPDYSSIKDINDRYKKNEDDLASLEKRNKRNALFAAIGDGIAALSNLYFTTKGAPSAKLSSATKAVQESYDKEHSRLELRGDKLLEQKLRLLDQQKAARLKHERLKIDQQLAEADRRYKEARSASERKRAEDNKEYLEKRLKILEAEKEADKKRKDRVADSTVGRNNAQGSAAKKRAGAYASDVANRNKNRDRDTNSKVANRGRDTETETVTYTDDDGVKRTTTSRRYVQGKNKGYANTAKTAKKYGW